MKPLLLLVVLAMTDACPGARQATPAGGGNVEMSTVARGSYALDDAGRKAVLARNEADYRRSWKELIGEGALPAADLEAGVVVFLLAGTRNTGGWSVEPQSVQVEDGTATIAAKVQGPPPGGITTQALTQPYAVVLVRDRSIQKVLWPK